MTLTQMAGVRLFVWTVTKLGEKGLSFLLGPARKLKTLRDSTIKAILTHSDLISNPGCATKEEIDRVSGKFKALATEWRLMEADQVMQRKLNDSELLSREKMLQNAEDLMGLSNLVRHRCGGELGDVSASARARASALATRLGFRLN